jgi:hypothetical protein
MSSPISSFKAVMEDMKARPSRNTMEGMIYNGTFPNSEYSACRNMYFRFR